MARVSITRRSVSRSGSAPRHAGRRILLAAVLLGALGAGPAGAQQAPPPGQPGQAPPQPPPRPTAMLPDKPQLEPIERLCPGVPPGEGRIKACVKAHVTALSAPCFDAMMGAVAGEREP